MSSRLGVNEEAMSSSIRILSGSLLISIFSKYNN